MYIKPGIDGWHLHLISKWALSKILVGSKLHAVACLLCFQEIKIAEWSCIKLYKLKQFMVHNIILFCYTTYHCLRAVVHFRKFYTDGKIIFLRYGITFKSSEKYFRRAGKYNFVRKALLTYWGCRTWSMVSSLLFCFSSLFDCTWIDAAGKLKSNTMSIECYSTFHRDFWQRLFCFF